MPFYNTDKNDDRLNTLESKAIFDQVNVKDYGAVGDGVTDDTDSINLAIAALSTNSHLIFPEGSYLTKDTITIPMDTHVNMIGNILYDGVHDRPAIYYNNSETRTLGNTLIFNVTSNDQSDWTNEDYVGVVIQNVRDSIIRIVAANSFTVGAKCYGNDDGFVYNEITLGFFYNNKKGLLLYEHSNGWVTENNFYGGHFAVASTTNTTSDRYGIVIGTSTDYANNHNNFHKPSFELHGGYVTGGAESINILINEGVLNNFYSIRSESSTTGVCARSTGGSRSNLITIGYSNESFDYPKYPIENNGTKLGIFYKPSEVTFGDCVSFPNILTKAAAYNSTYTWITHPLFVLTSAGAKSNYATGLARDNATNSLTVSGTRAIGVRIDLNDSRIFFVSVKTGADQGRVLLRGYDSSGNLLDDSGGALFKTNTNASLTYSSGWLGWYGGNDSLFDDYAFIADISVASVDIAVMGGTGSVSLQGFSVMVQSGGLPIIPEEYGMDDRFFATQAPDNGTYPEGFVVYKRSQVAGGTIGWVCVVGGTPGTWKEFGAISA